MVDASQVNNDRKWINTTLSILLKDLSRYATKDIAAYNKTFLPNSDYINSHINAKSREYTLFSDTEYLRYMRLMTRRLVEMIACLQIRGSADKIIIIMNLIDDLDSVKKLEVLKGHINGLLSFAGNMLSAA